MQWLPHLAFCFWSRERYVPISIQRKSHIGVMSLFFQRIVFFSQLSPFTVALMGCCVFCVGQGKGQASLSPFETQISSAFARARREGKPLWIMVSSPFCTPCRLLERLVLPHPSFQAALVRDFIPLKVYANGDSTSTLAGDALADRYAAYG
ncbi:MAG: thioredoxin family protein, partial [Bacteroidia bacterium]|nr:thioredoxin family protein [Bacteroidia bacterium]